MPTIKKNSTTPMLLSLAIGTFMSALDTSVVNIALPVIQNHFHVNLSVVEWVITAYLLIISSMLLTFGRLSDLYGHKKIYLSGFTVFTAGSFLCGFLSGIWMLVAFRIIQAVGAGMMFSTSSAIITGSTPAEKRGKAFGIIAIAVASACCVGPIVGGILADAFGWQSIFFINVPIGIIGIYFSAKSIPPDKNKETVPFDLIGSMLIFVSLFLIIMPLDLSGNGGISFLKFSVMLIAGVIFGVLFILYERKAKYPILKLALFKNRVFSSSLLAAVFNYTAQFIMVFLAPFYLEKIRLLSPSMAGALFLPMPLATILIAPVSGSFSDRHDSRIASSAGMGVMAVGMFLLSFLKVDTANWYIIIAMILVGIGSGMFQAPNNSAVMSSIPSQHRGAASGTLATMRNMGMVMGIAVSGALFNLNSSRATIAYSASGLSGLHLSQASFTYGLHITFMAAAVIALFAMISSLVKGKVKVEAENKGEAA